MPCPLGQGGYLEPHRPRHHTPDLPRGRCLRLSLLLPGVYTKQFLFFLLGGSKCESEAAQRLTRCALLLPASPPALELAWVAFHACRAVGHFEPPPAHALRRGVCAQCKRARVPARDTIADTT